MLMEKLRKLAYSENMVMDIIKSREHVLEFLNNNHIGTLATADETGTPHAATIYVTYDQQLNLYFVTKRDTQKGRNLAVNPKAAIALFDAMNQTTVQASGSVEEVSDTAQATRIYTEIENVVRRTSKSGVPPTSRLAAGSYVTYRLHTPAIRIASYSGNDDISGSNNIFEIVG